MTLSFPTNNYSIMLDTCICILGCIAQMRPIQCGPKKVIPLVQCNVMYERYHFFGPPCIDRILFLFQRYINCLFVCLLCSFLTFSHPYLLPFFYFLYCLFTSLLMYFLTCLSTSSRYPFHYQAGGRRMRPNLALVFLFCVNFMLWYILVWMHVCYCCVFVFKYLTKRLTYFWAWWDVKP